MIRFSVQIDELEQLIQRHLTGISDEEPLSHDPFVWTDGDSEVVVHPESLQVRLLPGWLQVAVDLEAEETGRAPLGVVFFLGRDGAGDGTDASAAFAKDSPEVLVEHWGPTLRDAAWGAVLDVFEAAIGWGETNVGGEMVFAGFGVNDETVMFVDVEQRAST